MSHDSRAELFRLMYERGWPTAIPRSRIFEIGSRRLVNDDAADALAFAVSTLHPRAKERNPVSLTPIPNAIPLFRVARLVGQAYLAEQLPRPAVGTQLQLLTEPGNIHDNFAAIAVDENGHKYGYLTRELAPAVTFAGQLGYAVIAVVTASLDLSLHNSNNIVVEVYAVPAAKVRRKAKPGRKPKGKPGRKPKGKPGRKPKGKPGRKPKPVPGLKVKER